MSDELKLCPLCGSHLYISQCDPMRDCDWMVSCENVSGCKVRPSTDLLTKGEAIVVWNLHTSKQDIHQSAETIVRLRQCESWLRLVQQAVANTTLQTAGEYVGKNVFLPLDTLEGINKALDDAGQIGEKE